MKIKHISAALAVAVLLPFAASALTTDDIQAQITRLLAQIAQLQEQLKQLTTTNPTPPACLADAKQCSDGSWVVRSGPNCLFAMCPGTVEVRPITRICPQIVRNLEQGITGSDVKEVQAYLGVSQTGFFGPQTAGAVAAFQAEEGLTQIGIVGPQTRAAFARRCGWGNNANFSASPTSGQAPLNVYFKYSGGNSLQNEQYDIDFGDGTSGAMLFIIPPCAPLPPGSPALPNYCQGSWQTSHTYTSNGTYQAKLLYQPPAPPCNAPPGAACMMVLPAPQVMGTVTITVGTTNTAMFTASPTSGAAPLTVQFSTSEKSGTIDFGDGTSGQVQQGPLGYCDSVNGCWGGGYGASHTYTTAGTYTAKLRQHFASNAGNCAGVDCNVVGSVVVTVSGSTSGTSINVSSPASGQNVALGGTLGVSWNSQNAPAGSAVGLWLVRLRPAGGVPLGCPDSNDPAVMPCGSENLGLIAANQNTSGNYTWQLPTPTPTLPATTCGAGSSAFDCIKQYEVDGVALAYPCPLDTPHVCGRTVTAGSYIIVAKLYTPANACLGGLCWPDSKPTYLASSQSGVFTIGGSTGGGGVPSITGLDAPSTLVVGQTGTWTVRLNTRNTGNLNYSVVWGDEGWGMRPFDKLSAAAPSIAASGTFTHAYQSAGTYSPKFTVSNSSGSAQTSASVVVGGSNICPVYQQPLCPTGYHVGPSTTNANGCSAPGSCIPDATTSNTFSASPTYGAAPLSVNFSYPYNSNTSGGQYTVNFGDGTSGQMTPFLTAMLCAFGSDCTQRGSWNANHTYASAGTYYAQLFGIPCNDTPGFGISSICAAPTVTISVTGGGAACGFGGCIYQVPSDKYTTAPGQGGATQVSTASSDSSGKYWCSAGAVSFAQSTPCTPR